MLCSYPIWGGSNQHTASYPEPSRDPTPVVCRPSSVVSHLPCTTFVSQFFFTWYMGDLGTKRGRHPIPAGDLERAMSREGIEPPTR